MKYYIGVDLGGTNTKIGILDNDFNILKEESIKTLSKEGPISTFERIWETIQKICLELNIDVNSIPSIGMGIPGPVVNQSIVKIAANFSWGNDFNAKELMEKITSKKVIVENDVRAITKGEYVFGAAKGYSKVAVVPIGTGISAGIIVNGNILDGSSGAAGEFGHIVINPKGHNCGCGLTGCLETYCSASGIKREAIIFLKDKKEGILYDKFKDNFEKLEALDVFMAYKENDKSAIEIVEKFSERLAYGLSTIINMINPELIVLAGGLSKSSDIIIPLVKKYLPKYALGISIDKLEIVKCKLLDSAGIKGAASLVL